MGVEMMFLDAARFNGIAAKQPLDVCSHPLIDQLEQPGRRRIKAIVEVEYPIADVRETMIH
jgi:hypothetical protein